MDYSPVLSLSDNYLSGRTNRTLSGQRKNCPDFDRTKNRLSGRTTICPSLVSILVVRIMDDVIWTERTFTIFLAKRKCILNTSMKNSKDSHKLTSILSSKIIIIILNYFKLNINSVLLVTCHPNKYRFKAKLSFSFKNLHTKVLRQIVTVRLKVLKLF